MTACIIMHNMIIEYEHDLNVPINNYMEVLAPEVERVADENTRFQEFFDHHREIKDKEAHIALQNVLIDHLCNDYSNLED